MASAEAHARASALEVRAREIKRDMEALRHELGAVKAEQARLLGITVVPNRAMRRSGLRQDNTNPRRESGDSNTQTGRDHADQRTAVG